MAATLDDVTAPFLSQQVKLPIIPLEVITLALIKALFIIPRFDVIPIPFSVPVSSQSTLKLHLGYNW